MPAGYERDLHRGHDGAARAVGPARAPDLQRPSQCRRVVPACRRLRARHHSSVGTPDADGRRDQRARPGRASRRDPRGEEANRERRAARARRSMSPAPRSPSWRQARPRPRRSSCRSSTRRTHAPRPDGSSTPAWTSSRSSSSIGCRPTNAARSSARHVPAAARWRCTAQTDAEIRLGLALGIDDFQHIGIDSPEYAPDIVAALRARTRSGPPLYWTPTIGANNLLNADYIATKPELLDDPEAYLGLPQALVDEIKAGWRDLQPRTARPDTEAIIKRKIAQLQEAGVAARVRQRRGQHRRAAPARNLDGCRAMGARARHGADGGAAEHDLRRGARDGRGRARWALSPPASRPTSSPSAAIRSVTSTCCAIQKW